MINELVGRRHALWTFIFFDMQLGCSQNEYIIVKTQQENTDNILTFKFDNRLIHSNFKHKIRTNFLHSYFYFTLFKIKYV